MSSELETTLTHYATFIQQPFCKSGPVDFFSTQRTLDFVRYFIRHSRRPFHRENKFGHVTSSGIVIDTNWEKVVLGHHKKLNKWLPLGGHNDGSSDCLATARREVEEESGLTSTQIVQLESAPQLPIDIEVFTIPSRSGEPSHYHFDFMYLFISDQRELVVSEESYELAWVDLDRLEDYNSEPALVALREKIYFFRNF